MARRFLSFAISLKQQFMKTKLLLLSGVVFLILSSCKKNNLTALGVAALFKPKRNIPNPGAAPLSLLSRKQ